MFLSFSQHTHPPCHCWQSVLFRSVSSQGVAGASQACKLEKGQNRKRKAFRYKYLFAYFFSFQQHPYFFFFSVDVTSLSVTSKLKCQQTKTAARLQKPGQRASKSFRICHRQATQTVWLIKIRQKKSSSLRTISYPSNIPSFSRALSSPKKVRSPARVQWVPARTTQCARAPEVALIFFLRMRVLATLTCAGVTSPSSSLK